MSLYDYCYRYILEPWYQPSAVVVPFQVNLTNLNAQSLLIFCNDVSKAEDDEAKSDLNAQSEVEYNQPMVLIGIYISVASLFCILAMVLDLLNGFRNRKFWFPTKYFSLNAASITVITVAMKLPVDLSDPMPREVDQVAKVGSLAFMCTMMSNLMPSLAPMDNKSLVANVTGLSILVITMVVNIFIQIKTNLIDHDMNFYKLALIHFSMVMVACIYMGMLIFLLVVLISSSLTIPTSKKILEVKYRAAMKTILDEYLQENLKSSEKLRQLVRKFWIIAETGNPQFVIASTTLSSASSIICATNMVMHILLVCGLRFSYLSELLRSEYDALDDECVYKMSTTVIAITQSIGIVLGSIAPICRCFTVLSFKSFDNQNKNQFLGFKVDKYWTEKLYEWKEIRVSILSSGRRSRALLHNSKNCILTFCIGFQKVIIVSCKIIELLPIVVMIFVMCCLRYLKSLKAKLFAKTTGLSSHIKANEDLRNYVLSLDKNRQLADKTMKGILYSMNHLIQISEKKHHNINILKLLEESVSFDGVEMFDTDQIQSLLSVEVVNSWSLPIISLTCIAVAIPNIHMDKVDNLIKSVSEGLLYTQLVEKALNTESTYVNIQRATETLWHEVEDNRKWLDTTLERSAYEGTTQTVIIKLFAHIAEEILNEFNGSTLGETVDNENLPQRVIAANSMYRIAKTIMHTYETNNLEITQDDLFTQLSSMIADILAACLTNIPWVIITRCQESAIEKREASVMAAIDLLGQSIEIIKKLETREVPNLDREKMGFIDEWRLHLRQP